MFLSNRFIRNHLNDSTITVEYSCQPDLFEAFVKFIELREIHFNLKDLNTIVSLLKEWEFSSDIYSSQGVDARGGG